MIPGDYSAAERERCVHHLRGLFGDLGPEVVDGILAVASSRTLAAGETLFAQGDAAGPLYVVLSGRLRAIATSPGGETESRRDIVLGDIAAGEPVGEMALFTGEPRMASVIALRPSRLLCVTEAHYLQLVRQFPALVLSLNRSSSAACARTSAHATAGAAAQRRRHQPLPPGRTCRAGWSPPG